MEINTFTQNLIQAQKIKSCFWLTAVILLLIEQDM